MRGLILGLLLTPLTASATTIYVQPATQTAPAGAYQTCSAVVVGQNDKSVTWSTSGGTLVPGQTGVNEPATAAITTTTPGTYTLTATTNTGGIAGHCTITFTATPTIVTGHPKLLVTAAMLPALQAKGTAANTVYQGILSNANSAFSSATKWSTFSTWNGTACVGFVGPSSLDISSGYFAYWSSQIALFDTNSATRNLWGCRAHDFFTYYEANVQNGNISLGAPTWSDSAEAAMLTGDWLLSKYLTGTEVSDVRTYLHWFGKQIIGGAIANGCTPSLTAAYNAPAQFNTGSVTDYANQRCAGSNYTFSRFFYLPAIGLTFDDNLTDDPTLANCAGGRYQICPDGSANSLHAYFNFYAGTMLYKYWAHIEDPQVAWTAYNTKYGNLPSYTNTYCKSFMGAGGLVPCFGDGRGGEASEGTAYGSTIARGRLALNIIHTAGYDDPLTWGPQISAVTSSYWDLYDTNMLNLLLGTVNISGNTNWFFITTGDSTKQVFDLYDFYADSQLLAFNSYTGRTDNNSLLLWPLLNVIPNGVSAWNANAWRGDGAFVLVGMFIALPNGDPTVSPPSDPRPTLPTDFYVGGNKHSYVRSGFTTTDSLVSTYSVDSFIDHEHSFAGKFEVFSGNEYITKGRTEFDDYNNTMTSAMWSNLIAITNNPVPNPAACGPTFIPYATAVSGQWWHGEQANFTAPVHSELPTYSAFIVDQLANYNTNANADCPGVTDATVARRSTVYLRGSKQIAFYDRAGTGSARDKSLYFNTTGTPTLAGNTFSWPTPSATQKAYLTSLLPASPTNTATTLTNANDQYLPGGSSNQCWASAFCEYNIGGVVQVDAGTVAGPVQFLHVLEWGASGFTKTSTSLVSSSAGQNFDGSLIGSSMVMFMRSPATFTGMTYAASGATNHLIADLAPNTSYAITGTGAPASATTDTAGVLSFAATGTGNITVGTAGSPTLTSITVTPNPGTVPTPGTLQMFAACLYSDSSTTPCNVVWSDTNAHSSINSSTGLVTYVSVGSDTVSATLSGVTGTATVGSAAPLGTTVLNGVTIFGATLNH